jgi:hypothetical protein
VQLSDYADGFENEEERILYSQLADAFSTMLNSLYEDPRFSETKYVAPVDSGEIKLKYWKLSVPQNVQCEESGQGAGYRAEFFGLVNNTRIPLYALYLGDAENPEDTLGTYTADGQALGLNIIVYDMAAYDS